VILLFTDQVNSVTGFVAMSLNIIIVNLSDRDYEYNVLMASLSLLVIRSVQMLCLCHVYFVDLFMGLVYQTFRIL